MLMASYSGSYRGVGGSLFVGNGRAGLEGTAGCLFFSYLAATSNILSSDLEMFLLNGGRGGGLDIIIESQVEDGMLIT